MDLKDILITLKAILINFELLEVVAVLILSIIIIMILLTKSVITQISSFTGILVTIFVVLFSGASIKTSFIIFDAFDSDATISKDYIVDRLLNRVKKEEKKTVRTSFDDGNNINRYPFGTTLGRTEYSEEEAKNSLDKIYENYGLDTIYYIQDVLLKAKKLKGSNSAIYISLEDYAFICSMNICDKYLYDFNDVKKSLGGYYLVVVLPEFLSTLENYIP